MYILHKLRNLPRKIFRFISGKGKRNRNRFWVVLSGVLLIIIVLSIVFSRRNGYQYAFHSRLIKMVDIGELSVSNIIFNGIVDMYSDNDFEKTNVICHVSYESTVKIGIDIEKIEFDIDTEAKQLRVILPEIMLQSPVIDVASLQFMPANPNIDIQDIISACRNDALDRAEKADVLSHTAENNLRSIIEALTLPLLEEEGYIFVY